MTAAVRAHASNSLDTGADPTVTISALIGDLLVVAVTALGATATTGVTDNAGGTYYAAQGRTTGPGAATGQVRLYIRDALIAANASVVITADVTGAHTSSNLAVVALTGVFVAGSTAFRQGASNYVDPPPAALNVTFGASVTAFNVVVAALMNEAASGTGHSAPSGFTTQEDTGNSEHSLQIATKITASGTTVGWGTLSEYGGAVSVELDGTPEPAVGTGTPTLGAVTASGAANAVTQAVGAITIGAVTAAGIAWPDLRYLGAVTCVGEAVMEADAPLVRPRRDGIETIDDDLVTFRIPRR